MDHEIKRKFSEAFRAQKRRELAALKKVWRAVNKVSNPHAKTIDEHIKRCRNWVAKTKDLAKEAASLEDPLANFLKDLGNQLQAILNQRWSSQLKSNWKTSQSPLKQLVETIGIGGGAAHMAANRLATNIEARWVEQGIAEADQLEEKRSRLQKKCLTAVEAKRREEKNKPLKETNPKRDAIIKKIMEPHLPAIRRYWMENPEKLMEIIKRKEVAKQAESAWKSSTRKSPAPRKSVKKPLIFGADDNLPRGKKNKII